MRNAVSSTDQEQNKMSQPSTKSLLCSDELHNVTTPKVSKLCSSTAAAGTDEVHNITTQPIAASPLCSSTAVAGSDEVHNITTQPTAASPLCSSTVAVGSHPSTGEIIMNLDQVCPSGQRMKFSLPGVSQAVTLNFSAEALQEMKN